MYLQFAPTVKEVGKEKGEVTIMIFSHDYHFLTE